MTNMAVYICNSIIHNVGSSKLYVLGKLRISKKWGIHWDISQLYPSTLVGNLSYLASSSAMPHSHLGNNDC